MNLEQAFRQPSPAVDFRRYLVRSTLPPLDLAKLSIQPGVAHSVPMEGEESLVLTYKMKAAAVTSLREEYAGSVWKILQFQGAKEKGLRVAACLQPFAALADQIVAYAGHPDADVRHLTMPSPHDVTNILEARHADGALARYAGIARRLGMTFSKEQNVYIVDVAKGVRTDLLGRGIALLNAEETL